MNARLDAFASPVTGKLVKHLVAAGKIVEGTSLPAATQELVKIRASQINGCGGCLDMHTKEAAAAGETSLRLNLIAAWRSDRLHRRRARRAGADGTGHPHRGRGGQSRTTSGRTPPSTTTRSSSSPWSR